MADFDFDVAIIGGGPGGYVAAIRAGQLGLRTALVEEAELGGICLNWGCIPSKALLKNAEVLNLFHRSEEFGITVDNLQYDFGKAIDRSRGVVRRLTAGVGMLLRKNKVEHSERPRPPDGRAHGRRRRRRAQPHGRERDRRHGRSASAGARPGGGRRHDHRQPRGAGASRRAIAGGHRGRRRYGRRVRVSVPRLWRRGHHRRDDAAAHPQRRRGDGAAAGASLLRPGHQDADRLPRVLRREAAGGRCPERGDAGWRSRA